MAMTYEEYHAFVEALLAHPEWRAELRPLILGEELMALPQWQARTDNRLDRIEQAIAELVEAQRRTDAQIAALTERMDRVEARLERVEARLEGVENRLERVEARLERVEHRLGRVEGRMGNIEGGMLEARYERNMAGLMDRYLRHAHAVSVFALPSIQAALDRGTLARDEVERVLDLDFLVAGELPGGQPAVAAVEVSTMINEDDVSRAVARAAILRKADLTVLAVVGGYGIRDDARVLAEAAGVLVDVRRPPASA